MPPGPLDRSVFGVSAKGYVGAEFIATPAEWRAIERGEDIDGVLLILKRAATLSGRVLDAKGEPVAGAQVAIFTDVYAEVFRTGDGRVHCMKADDTGHFEFSAIAPRAGLFVAPASTRSRSRNHSPSMACWWRGT